MGDPSQTTVPAEFNETHHGRGILSAARTPDPNSATSQFFICVADAGFLDRQYTVYGEVLKGMDVADKIVNSKRDGADNPLEKIEMTITKVTK
jgi:peptidyl-prolyl cis-trans isomerase B (cyclophilin B)